MFTLTGPRRGIKRAKFLPTRTVKLRAFFLILEGKMEEKSQKKPSFQFYPGDWRRDPNLQQNSLAARGLWQEILCIMHDQPERGILSLETEKNLWRLVGDKDSNVRRLLKELENSGVFSRDEKGRMFNRRMVRDTKLSLTRSACGSLGGNPNLVNQNSSNGLSKFEAKPKQTVEQNPTPSSSSSSSKINTPPPPQGEVSVEKTGGEPKRRNASEYSPEFESFWTAYPRKEAKGSAYKAWQKQKPPLSACLSALAWQKKSDQWIKDAGSFIPHPASWINARRWEDEPAPAVSTPTHPVFVW